MNAATARRKRIIRVRSVEHQMAEAKLARAQGELANLVELSQRLEALRADLAVAKGVISGRAMNSVGELAMRLDMAKESLIAPMQSASQRRDQAGKVAQLALVKEESAQRLYERTRKSEEVEAERRRDANRPHRPRAMSLRLMKGGLA
jgi:hypothetical protein